VQTAREAPVLIFTGELPDSAKAKALHERGVETASGGFKGRELLAIMDELGKRSLQSVLVEGGATVAGNLIDAVLVDKVTFFLAPVIIGGRDAPSAISGVGAERLIDALKLEDVEIVQRGRDFEVTGYPARAKDEG
jgi:diaminohydroxyphosphoribosylaminopyrimidine deaminase / 5-amino-6-(5-phosphoribosylamino)uracil reductase